MVDTVRTEAELLVIFADNSTQEISEQDMRDYVVSIYDEDRKGEVKISSNDTVKDTLGTKLVSGTNITLTENNDGGNETLTVASTSPGQSGSGTDNHLVRWDGTSDLQDSTHILGDNGNLAGGYTAVSGTIISSSTGSHALGHANNSATITASGIGSFAGGISDNSNYITASGDGAFAFGSGEYGDLLASGDGSVALGGDSTASGFASFACGYKVTATNLQSVAFGNYADATARSAFAAGTYVEAQGAYSQAFGRSTYAYGDRSHAHGSSVAAWGNSSHAEGSGTEGVGSTSHAEGSSTKSHGGSSHSEGRLTVSSGYNSHAEGIRTHVGYDARSCTLSGTTVTISGDVTSEFTNGDTVTGYRFSGGATPIDSQGRTISSVSYSAPNTTFTLNSAFGDRTSGFVVSNSKGIGAHAGGYTSVSGNIRVLGQGAFVHGSATGSGTITSSGDGGFAHGNAQSSGAISTSVAGKGSFAGGYATGVGSTIIASGLGATAHGHAGMGGDILSSGSGSFAGGYCFAPSGTVTASGFGSFAWGHHYGYTTLVSGNGSAAFGKGITISSPYTFSAGDGNTISATKAVAFGFRNEVILPAFESLTFGRYGKNKVATSFCQSNSIDSLLVGSNQFTRAIFRVDTTDATSTELTTDGSINISARFRIGDEHTYDCWIRVLGRQDTGAAHAEFTRKVLIERTGGTTALVGSVQTIGTDIGSSGGSPPAGWALSLTADNTEDFLNISVTGAAATNIRWTGVIEAIETEYSD